MWDRKQKEILGWLNSHGRQFLRRGETVLAKHSGYMEVRLREESHTNKEILSNVRFQIDLAAWATTPYITHT